MKAVQEKAALTHVPQGWTECEMYRGYVIATRSGWYAAYGWNFASHRQTSRADVRRVIDNHLDI